MDWEGVSPHPLLWPVGVEPVWPPPSPMLIKNNSTGLLQSDAESGEADDEEEAAEEGEGAEEEQGRSRWWMNER